MDRPGLLRRALPFLPVVLWMALIFSFSTLQEPRFASNGTADLVIKKVGHFTLYAVLALTLGFAFDRVLADGRRSSWPVRLAFGLAVLFAASDELHQAFTPTRDPSVIDVGIDSLGALAGVLVWHLVGRRWVGRARTHQPGPPPN